MEVDLVSEVDPDRTRFVVATKGVSVSKLLDDFPDEERCHNKRSRNEISKANANEETHGNCTTTYEHYRIVYYRDIEKESEHVA